MFAINLRARLSRLDIHTLEVLKKSLSSTIVKVIGMRKEKLTSYRELI